MAVNYGANSKNIKNRQHNELVNIGILLEPKKGWGGVNMKKVKNKTSMAKYLVSFNPTQKRSGGSTKDYGLYMSVIL